MDKFAMVDPKDPAVWRIVGKDEAIDLSIQGWHCLDENPTIDAAINNEKPSWGEQAEGYILVAMLACPLWLPVLALILDRFF